MANTLIRNNTSQDFVSRKNILIQSCILHHLSFLPQPNSTGISLTTMLTTYKALTKRLWLWLNNDYMPLILSGFGAILLAFAFNLMLKASDNREYFSYYSKQGNIIFVVSVIVYATAIFLQWSKERADRKREQDREDREIERHEQHMLQFSPRPNKDKEKK